MLIVQEFRELHGRAGWEPGLGARVRMWVAAWKPELSSLGGTQFSHLEESCWFTGMGMDGQISEEGQHLEGTLAVTESCAWRLPCGLC